MNVISYSQNFEDIILWRALKNIENGFYIDVGANDPVVHSVTKLFYENGWRGINCEPVEYWFERIVYDRPRDINLQVAIGSKEQPLKFYEVVGTGLSTLNEHTAEEHAKNLGFDVLEYYVPVKSLDSICKENNVSTVHFLKVDVESVEKDVLESFSFKEVRPWIVVVEATKPMTQIDISNEWEYMLFENDYSLAYFDGLNKFYVSSEHSELKNIINCPPNTFDKFILSEHQTAIWEKEEEVKR